MDASEPIIGIDANGKRCITAFLLGYILAESGVSITAFLL
jgi:hypothetical protein